MHRMQPRLQVVGGIRIVGRAVEESAKQAVTLLANCANSGEHAIERQSEEEQRVRREHEASFQHFRNDLRGGRGWIAVKLQGTRSDRAALGATVRVTSNGRTQARVALSQSSYYSHDDLRLHFGLGAATRADTIEVRWPSGNVETVHDVPGGRVVTIREGAGIVER